MPQNQQNRTISLRDAVRLLLVLCGLPVLVCAQTVSNIHFDGVGDSSARVLFDVTGSFNSLFAF